MAAPRIKPWLFKKSKGRSDKERQRSREDKAFIEIYKKKIQQDLKSEEKAKKLAQIISQMLRDN